MAKLTFLGGIHPYDGKELSKDIEISKVDMIMKFLEIDGTNIEKLNSLEELEIQDEIFKEGLEELTKVIKFIKIFGVPEEYVKVDWTIARGLDYYTGTVYETFLNKNRNFGSICSGGRYDNLSGFYSDRKMPGVGIAIGLTRLFYLLTDNEIISAENESISDALVISMTDDYEKSAEVATKLRQEGLNVQINIEEQKIAKKFKYANSLNVKYVIIMGEDEIKNDVVTLKNMYTGEQNTIKIEEAIKVIKG